MLVAVRKTAPGLDLPLRGLNQSVSRLHQCMALTNMLGAFVWVERRAKESASKMGRRPTWFSLDNLAQRPRVRGREEKWNLTFVWCWQPHLLFPKG